MQRGGPVVHSSASTSEERFRVQMGFNLLVFSKAQTYCSLGKVYAATPGGGEDRPCIEGYLKTAVVCDGGE